MKAIRSQLTGPQFVWVLPGWYRPGWWNVSDINCTAEEMKNGLEHSLSIAVDSVIANDLSRMTVSGKVAINHNTSSLFVIVILECFTVSTRSC